MERNVFCLKLVSIRHSISVSINLIQIPPLYFSIISHVDYSFTLLLFYLFLIAWLSAYYVWRQSPDNLFQISSILPPILLTWVLSTIWPPHLSSEEINIQNSLRAPPIGHSSDDTLFWFLILRMMITLKNTSLYEAIVDVCSMNGAYSSHSSVILKTDSK